MRLLPLLSLVLALLLFFMISGTQRDDQEVLASAATQQPAPSGLVDLERFARRKSDARAPVIPKEEPPATRSAYSHVRGQLLKPDGSPLADVSLALSGQLAGDRQHAAPERSEPVELETSTDLEGRFALLFESPEFFEWSLVARQNDRADKRWNFQQLEPGTYIDLGPLAMQASGAVGGLVSDKFGQPATLGWTIYAWSVDAGYSAYSEVHAQSATSSASTEAGSYLISGLDPGRHEMRAQLDTGRWVELPAVVIRAGEVHERNTTLPLSERDRTIVIHAPTAGFSIARSDVTLIDRFGIETHPTANGQVFTFPDLETGPFRCEINDIRFEPVTLRDLEPGRHAVLARLVGTAALRLSVTDIHTRAQLPKWSLRLAYRNPAEIESPHELTTVLSAWQSPPAGGLFLGIVPEPLWLIVGAHGYADRLIALQHLGPMETRQLDVPLESSTRVPGRVQTVAGSPCAEARVELHQNGIRVATTRTNTLGRFCFEGIQPGIYSLTCEADGGRVAQPTEFELIATAALRERVLEVPDGYWLHGSIRARALESIESCEIYAQLANREPPQFQRAEISLEGKFRVGPFTSGEVALRLALPESQFTLDLGTHTVGSETETCFIDLYERVPGEVLVQVNLSDASYAGVVVEAQLTEHNDRQRVVLSVDAEGFADFGLVPPGEFEFTVRGPVDGAQGTWSHAVRDSLRVFPGERSFTTIDDPLVFGELLVLDVIDAEPLRDAWVDLLPQFGVARDTIRVRTGPKGRIRIALTPGSYWIRRRGSEGLESSPQSVEWSATGPVPGSLVLPY